MSPQQRNLDDYITVAERVVKFYESFPEGSLQSEIIEYDGKHVLIKALAYRDRTDHRPGIGHAEELRAEGPVNKTAMVENAETSAWGRAIAALGFEVKKGIASREEMELARARAEAAREAAELDRVSNWDQKQADETITQIEQAVTSG